MPKLGMELIRKKQVIEATLKCIAECGLEKITQDMVAKKAGVSKGVVTYYFKTKHQLLFESYQSFLDNYLYSIEQYLKESNSLMDVIEIIVAHTLGVLPDKKRVHADKSDVVALEPIEIKKITAQMYARVADNEAYKSMVYEVYNAYYKAIKEVIDLGIEKKEFKTQASDRAAYQIMVLLEGMLMYDIIEFHLPEVDSFEMCMAFVKKILI